MSDENTVTASTIEASGPVRESWKTPEHCVVPGCKSTHHQKSFNWTCTSKNPGHPGAPPIN